MSAAKFEIGVSAIRLFTHFAALMRAYRLYNIKLQPLQYLPMGLRIFSRLIDFRLRPHRLSAPLRPDVSRQQSRSFNDLQGHRVPNSATAFDNRRCIGLKAKIPLTKGRLPEACREVEWVRYPRADLQSAPGRPWEDARPAL